MPSEKKMLISPWRVSEPLSMLFVMVSTYFLLLESVAPDGSPRLILISIHKHYAIGIAYPSSMPDACHLNFVRDLDHCGVSVAQW